MSRGPHRPGQLAWCLTALAAFEALSTSVGAIELLVSPQWFAPMLDGTAFANRYVLAAMLLGVVVGGPQWAAIAIRLRRPRWTMAAQTLAGTVMLGWIAGECLVMDSFIWPHALWGGLGALQLVLVAVALGALKPQDTLRKSRWAPPWTRTPRKQSLPQPQAPGSSPSPSQPARGSTPSAH